MTLFMWLYFEDVVRRLLPGQPFEVTFIKEIVVLAIYFSFFISLALRPQMRKVFRRLPFIPALSLLFSISLLSPVYTLEPSTWAAVLGVRSYYWYLPLALIGYHFFRDESAFSRLTRALVITSIPLTLFASFQLVFYDKIDFVLMRPFGAGDQFHSFLNAQIPFISSFFGSHARYARLSIMLFYLSLALMLEPSVSKLKRRTALASLLFSAVGIFLSGQRTSMYSLFLGLFGYVLLMILGNWELKINLKVRNMVRTGIGLVIVIAIVIFLWFPTLGYYFLDLTSVFERFAEFLPSDIIVSVRKAGLNGFGFGSASQGIQYLTKFASLRSTIGIESGIGKIWYEMGFPGTIAFVLFGSSVVFFGVKRTLEQSLAYRKAIAAAITLYCISILFDFFFLHHQALGDATTLIFLWFFVGVLFGMERWPLENQINRPLEAL